MAFNTKTLADHRTGSMHQAPRMGPGFVPAYQISPDPFFRMIHLQNGEVRKLSFPSVTRYIEITNHTTGSVVRIGITENGVALPGSTSYYDLSGSMAYGAENGPAVPQKFGPFELRTTVLFFSASVSANIDLGVFAGLTTIPASSWPLITGSDGWQGVG